jgi:mono/diheme cytochrome c family protein
MKGSRMMPGRMTRRRPLFVLTALALTAAAAVGCGQEKGDVKQPNAKVPTVDAADETGAKLFVERCSGCHNLNVVGAEGGAQKVRDRERPDGPNFNVRKEDPNSVLYAIRNGGFSGAIMPQDIVVGKEAEQVAAFLAKYAGHGKSKNARN